jgi:hypothetical protein
VERCGISHSIYLFIVLLFIFLSYYYQEWEMQNIMKRPYCPLELKTAKIFWEWRDAYAKAMWEQEVELHANSLDRITRDTGLGYAKGSMRDV